MSWADMAQEDELEEEEEENEVNGQSVNRYGQSGEATVAVKVQQKPERSREQREYILFSNVKRKKDFICLERFKERLLTFWRDWSHTGSFQCCKAEEDR
ncbi:RNA demethylase ALKBH9B [Camellia lanceoleosa]|uniref:RNA demethylase ALKBH9B n=1 Tax=Camellia lanceoleosa TaxID=1840588 RepID=A0ACC0HZZ2_9ERIC|nr:RNA demethylase ALKBH9B [Camellia lanceoleosa]